MARITGHVVQETLRSRTEVALELLKGALAGLRFLRLCLLACIPVLTVTCLEEDSSSPGRGCRRLVRGSFVFRFVLILSSSFARSFSGSWRY